MSKKKPNLKKEHMYPDEIIIIPNSEKKFHESYFEGRNLCNFIHPYRMLLCSLQPNLGKTLWIKNILIRANPKFKQIFLLHCGEDLQTEYDDIDYICLRSIPEINSEIFNPKLKSLMIIEDKNFKYFSKQDLHRLDRHMGFSSTHRNLSIIIASQSYFDVPFSDRRMSSKRAFWKTKDVQCMQTIGRRCGFSKGEIHYLVKTYLKDIHDTLWIDCTKNTKFPVRLNCFTPIPESEYIGKK